MKYILAILVLSLGSCGSSLRINNPLADGYTPPPGINLAFDQIMYWGSALAGLAVLAGIVLLWLDRKKGQQVLCIAFSVLIGAQISLWISAHLWWIGVITVVLGLGWIAYKHRAKIEDMLDGNDEQLPGNPEG